MGVESAGGYFVGASSSHGTLRLCVCRSLLLCLPILVNMLTCPLPTAIHPPSFYLTEGFLHLENIVGQSIIDWKCSQEEENCNQELTDVAVAVRVSA